MESLLPADSRSVQNPLSLLRAHWLSAGLVFVAVIGGMLAVTAVSKRQFRSETKLLVKVGRASVALDPTATIGPFVGVADTRESELQTIEELALSQTVLGRVVDEMGIDAILGPEKIDPFKSMPWLESWNLNPLHAYDRRAKAIRNLTLDLEISIPKDSKVVTIAYEAESPETAKEIVGRIVDAVKDEHLRVNRTEGSQEFFSRESQRLHDEVRKLERELAELKSTTGIASYDEQRKIRLEQIARLEDELARTGSLLASREAEIKERQSVLAKIPSTQTTQEVSGAPNNPEDNMRVEVFKLQIREKELASRFSEDNIQLKQVREQLKAAEEVVANEGRRRQITQGVNGGREKYEDTLRERIAEATALRVQASHLTADLESARRRIDALNEGEPLLREKERAVSLADAAYRRYQESYEITRIEEQREAEKISNINSLQQPSYSLQPVKPNLKFNLAVGFVLACLASIATAWWADRPRPSSPRTSSAALRTSILEPEQLHDTVEVLT